MNWMRRRRTVSLAVVQRGVAQPRADFRARAGLCSQWRTPTSDVRQPFECFGVSIAPDTYCRGGAFDLGDIVAGELDFDGADVLFESVQFGGPRYRCDPWSLGRSQAIAICAGVAPLRLPITRRRSTTGLVRLTGFDREARQPVAAARPSNCPNRALPRVGCIALAQSSFDRFRHVRCGHRHLVGRDPAGEEVESMACR